jgi:hypothetical protein
VSHKNATFKHKDSFYIAQFSPTDTNFEVKTSKTLISIIGIREVIRGLNLNQTFLDKAIFNIAEAGISKFSDLLDSNVSFIPLFYFGQ